MKTLASLFRTPVLIAVLVILCGCSGSQPEQQATGKEILVIFPHGFGINYYLLQDVIDQNGWNVTYAGITDSVEVCGPFAQPRGGLAMKVDTLLKDMTDLTGYDAVMILSSTQFSGDDPYADIMGSEHTMNLISAAIRANTPVFTTCAGVRILAALDVINGLSVTGSKKYQDEFEAAGATYLGVDPAPQILGNLITSSRGQYNNVPNGIAASTVIEGAESADDSPTSSHQAPINVGDAVFRTADVAWAKTYGGVSSDGARSVCATDDGGLLMVGYTFSHGSDNADVLVIKTDAAGDSLWCRTYGGDGTEYGYACTEVDGGYLITGYTTSPCPRLTDKQLYLLKIDPDGREIWSQSYGGSKAEMGTSVCRVDDGYVVCGLTESKGAGEADIYILRTDTEGKELWSKTFGGQYTDMGNSVLADNEGNLLIGATTNSFGGGNSDFYVIKADAAGNEIWSNAYHPTGEHGHGFDWGNGLCAGTDGSCYAVGYSDCDDLMNAYVIKIDADGRQIWAKSFGNDFYDYGNAVCPAPDGGVYVCGTTKELFNNNDFYWVRLDPDGNIVSQEKIGGDGADWAGTMCITSDGGCVLVGHTSSAGAGAFDICAVKIGGH
ncbi:MAG: DJ-1/PfpI family protein [Candidatus Zixiibacteriota bacterium]|nr:MAG: DJ-1/PfpI family protein [candidate division Zixibacteria bacterium]